LGGVANNISGNVFLNGVRNYRKERVSLDNTLKINVGAISTKLKDLNNQEFRSTKKNIDNVFFDAKLGYAFPKIKWLSLYGGVNLQTQLLKGFSYGSDSLGREIKTQTSGFLSPGTLVPAVGFEAKHQDWLYLRVGLGAVKVTTIMNQKLYALRNEKSIAGVDSGKFLNAEAGFQVQGGLARNFGKQKQYTLKANYLGFAPYAFMSSTSPLDSRIDLGFVAKISKYINFNYTLISVFDKDLVKPGTNAWQNSWILGLGFMMKF
jgi:hypothetical protein